MTIKKRSFTIVFACLLTGLIAFIAILYANLKQQSKDVYIALDFSDEVYLSRYPDFHDYDSMTVSIKDEELLLQLEKFNGKYKVNSRRDFKTYPVLFTVNGSINYNVKKRIDCLYISQTSLILIDDENAYTRYCHTFYGDEPTLVYMCLIEYGTTKEDYHKQRLLEHTKGIK